MVSLGERLLGPGGVKGRPGVRIEDGHWMCEQCGAVVDMPFNDPWHAELHTRGGEPNVRVVIAAGQEVHRCEAPGSVAASPIAAPAAARRRRSRSRSLRSAARRRHRRPACARAAARADTTTTIWSTMAGGPSNDCFHRPVSEVAHEPADAEPVASRRHVSRKPTPCTRPSTFTRRRTAGDAGLHGRIASAAGLASSQPSAKRRCLVGHPMSVRFRHRR